MKIESFYVKGEARDHEWIIDNREMFEEYVRNDMREKGFIPVIDIPIQITWEYDSEMRCHLKVIAKGVKVGCRRSKKAMGYMSKEGFIVSKDAEQVELFV